MTTRFANETIDMTSDPFTTHLFWPETDKKLHFYALHPNSLSSGVTSPSANATDKSLSFGFETNASLR